jgi:CheY-like chemotaxis protein
MGQVYRALLLMNNGTNQMAATTSGERQRILIVEDNRAIASALKIVLQHEGYETRWCEDESVYGVIHDWKPSLILMDLKMPRLDGYHVTSTIKSDPETMGIPVIVVTAENVTRERLAEMHANDLLTKPFPVPRLLERVAFWINQPEEPVTLSPLAGHSAPAASARHAASASIQNGFGHGYAGSNA